MAIVGAFPRLGGRTLEVWRSVRETFVRFWAGNAPTHGAALAFYTLFSLAPVLLIAVEAAGVLFGEQAARAEIARQLERLAGPAAAQLGIDVLAKVADESGGGAGTIGILALLLGATTVFNQLQEAFNDIWEVQPKPGRLIRDFLRKRLLSFGLVLAIGFLLVVSLVVSAAIAAFAERLNRWLTVDAPALAALELLAFFLLLTVLLGLIYRIVPDARIEWRDIAVGATSTALALALGKLAIGFYLGRTAVATVWGAAGALVVLLLWVYYSSMILLLGAGFTRVYSRRTRPHGVEPEPGAERKPAAALRH